MIFELQTNYRISLIYKIFRENIFKIKLEKLFRHNKLLVFVMINSYINQYWEHFNQIKKIIKYLIPLKKDFRLIKHLNYKIRILLTFLIIIIQEIQFKIFQRDKLQKKTIVSQIIH